MTLLQGGCHCGALRIEFETPQAAATFHPRACDCSFCCKHGAAWISDKDGGLTIREHQAGALRDYRQGSQAARFLLCAQCGVCVAVVFEDGAQRFGAVNATILDAGAGLGEAVPASPQTLGAEEKQSRWRSLWIADVVIRPADR